jgi:hypothetical protein
VSHSIKPDLLGFPGIGVFACELRIHKVHIILIVIFHFRSFHVINFFS